MSHANQSPDPGCRVYSGKDDQVIVLDGPSEPLTPLSPQHLERLKQARDRLYALLDQEDNCGTNGNSPAAPPVDAPPTVSQ